MNTYKRKRRKIGDGGMRAGVKDLLTWCNQNGEFGEQLKSEWTGLLEDGTPIKMNEIAKGTSKRVRWRCSKGHIWTVGVNSRTYYHTTCPYCLNRKERPWRTEI